MISKMQWSEDEILQMEKYFSTGIGEMTLYQRLHKLNPKRTYEAMMRQIRRMKEKGYAKNKNIALEKLRIGYLDIETTGLNANFDYIVSWCIKPEGSNKFDYGIITKKEICDDYTFDKRLVIELCKSFENYDVLYTHFGSDRKFDVPFIRTRAYDWKLEHLLPNYMEAFIMDTWPIARNKLKLHSNRLDVIADLLDIKTKKTKVLPRIWREAKVGRANALNYVFDHNKKDV